MRAQVLPFRLSPFDLAVIAATLVILAAIIYPVVTMRHRYPSRVVSQAQINAIASASESYMLAFGEPPGYFDDANLQFRHFTAAENLVLSLMGGPTPADEAAATIAGPHPPMRPGWIIDPTVVGSGPRTVAGQAYGSFFSPKPQELDSVTGTLVSDNTMPELVDLFSGMPILYYRFDNDYTSNTAGNWYDGSVALGREVNGDYFNAKKLTSLAGSNDVTGSLLRADVNGPGGANELLSKLATNQELGVIAGRFLLISPGKDGVWFDAAERPAGQTLDLDDFDDLWVVGGF